jgi:hypothetical protein
MATAKPSSSTEIEDIQRRMAQIRHDMHEEVLVAVKGARSLTNWRSLVRNYPLAALGVATAIGYVIVPRRRSEAPTIVAVNATAPEIVAMTELQKPSQRQSATAWSIAGTVFNLVTPIMVRAAQNYALLYIVGLLAQHELPPEQVRRERRNAANGARPGAATEPVGRLREPR